MGVDIMTLKARFRAQLAWTEAVRKQYSHLASAEQPRHRPAARERRRRRGSGRVAAPPDRHSRAAEARPEGDGAAARARPSSCSASSRTARPSPRSPPRSRARGTRTWARAAPRRSPSRRSTLLLNAQDEHDDPADHDVDRHRAAAPCAAATRDQGAPRSSATRRPTSCGRRSSSCCRATICAS